MIMKKFNLIFLLVPKLFPAVLFSTYNIFYLD